MRKKWKRLFCAVMVMLMCMTMLPLAASAEKAETGKNEIKDYVLLLDCSGTMNQYDPYRLCAAACRQFMDQVPLENARISIIAFGYPEGEAYQMEVDKNQGLLKYVHLVTPLQETSTVKNTKGIKETIDEVTGIHGGVTPIGIAMLAAVDHLEKNGSTDKNAAIILITDGGITTGQHTASYDVGYVDLAVQRANEHEWKMFAIQMNERGANGDNSEETVRMSSIAQSTGVGDFGHVNVKDFSKGSLDINVAIAQIITYMSGNGTVPEPIFMTLPAEETLNVGDLASECNITILGSNVKSITITYPDGTSRVVTGNIDEERLVTSWEENSRNIKLIVPEAGDYTVKAEGQNSGEETAILFNYLVMDPSLEMISDPVMEPEKILSKDESITFDAHFTYHGIDILNNQYYTQHPAELRVISSAGSTKTFQMNATADGYSYTLPMHEAGNGGAYTAQIWIADSRFTGGGEYSNEIHFKTENLLPTITNSALPSLEGYIGQSFEKIDLSAYLSNPDSDTLDYQLNCVSDRNVTFEYDVENDYMTIQCGMVPGEYEMELSFKDYEMTEYLTFDNFKLVVTERPIASVEIPDVEVWVDSFSFQDVGAESALIDLQEYFTDPDGLPLEFSTVTGEEGYVQVEQSGSVLNITPLLKGETVLRFTVNDTFNTVEGQLNVNVISGKSLFWAKNGIWFAIAGVVLILTIIVVIGINKKIRVKGIWNIYVTENYKTAQVEGLDIFHFLSVGKKKKFTLYQMLNEVRNYADGDATVATHIPDYFSGDAGRVMLKGVLAPRGCKILEIPEGRGISVTVCGIPAGKSATYTGNGVIEIKIEKADMNGSTEMVIKMELASST